MAPSSIPVLICTSYWKLVSYSLKKLQKNASKLTYKRRPANRDTHSRYSSSAVTVHSPTSTKLSSGTLLDPTCSFCALPQKIWWKIALLQFFAYKSLSYATNCTKCETFMETPIAHKIYKVHKYRARHLAI